MNDVGMAAVEDKTESMPMGAINIKKNSMPDETLAAITAVKLTISRVF